MPSSSGRRALTLACTCGSSWPRGPASCSHAIVVCAAAAAVLRSGGGPFRELLIELNPWEPGAIAAGTRPLEYLRMLGNDEYQGFLYSKPLTAREVERRMLLSVDATAAAAHAD